MSLALPVLVGARGGTGPAGIFHRRLATSSHLHDVRYRPISLVEAAGGGRSCRAKDVAILLDRVLVSVASRRLGKRRKSKLDLDLGLSGLKPGGRKRRQAASSAGSSGAAPAAMAGKLT